MKASKRKKKAESRRGAAVDDRLAGSGGTEAAGAAAAVSREKREFTVQLPGEGAAFRADRYIAEVLGLMKRSQLKAREAEIAVDGKPAKLSRLLKNGERLAVEWSPEPPGDLIPEDIPLSIVYEDSRVLLVDKAQGMVTHPGAGNHTGTLANALLFRLNASRQAGPAGAAEPRPQSAAGAPSAELQSAAVPEALLPARAGIVHRLDKDTSGLLIAAKDAATQAFLCAQFKDRTAHKEYLAICRGVPVPLSGRIENRLVRDPRNRKRFCAAGPAGADSAPRGRLAITEYRVLYRYGNYCLVALKPKTGRTHQLRVHLAGLGTPIVGDPIYGHPDPVLPGATLMLHAYRLRIRLPGEAEARLFRSPLPQRFKTLLAGLEGRFGREKLF